MIVVEGPDNSGKSTLIKQIQDFCDWPTIHCGGPCHSQEEADHRSMMERQFSGQNLILDRSFCISESIYAYCLSRPQYVRLSDALKSFPSIGPDLLVYCRPAKDQLILGKHERGEHDTPTHLTAVEDNKHKILSTYDTLLGERFSTLHYDYTDIRRSAEALRTLRNYIARRRN